MSVNPHETPKTDADRAAGRAQSASLHASFTKRRDPCHGCDGTVPAGKSFCANCCEDMGYSRRAR